MDIRMEKMVEFICQSFEGSIRPKPTNKNIISASEKKLTLNERRKQQIFNTIKNFMNDRQLRFLFHEFYDNSLRIFDQINLNCARNEKIHLDFKEIINKIMIDKLKEQYSEELTNEFFSGF